MKLDSKTDSRTVINTNTIKQKLQRERSYQEKPWERIDSDNILLGNREKYIYLNPYIPVMIFRLKQMMRLATIVDSGVIINIISQTLCNRLGLEIQDTSEHNIQLVKGLISGLDRVINNITISVESLSFNISFFVISGANYYYILSQPF